MFSVSNNMIDVKKSRGREYFVIPSNKETGSNRSYLTTKFSTGWKYWLDHVRGFCEENQSIDYSKRKKGFS